MKGEIVVALVNATYITQKTLMNALIEFAEKVTKVFKINNIKKNSS